MSYPRTVHQLANQLRFFAREISARTSEEMEELFNRGCSQQTADVYNDLHKKLELIIEGMEEVLKIAQHLNLEVK